MACEGADGVRRLDQCPDRTPHRVTLGERMSQRAPSVMMVRVRSSPGTANGSEKRTFVLFVAITGPLGDVLR
jgi:hypothetical protein